VPLPPEAWMTWWYAISTKLLGSEVVLIVRGPVLGGEVTVLPGVGELKNAVVEVVVVDFAHEQNDTLANNIMLKKNEAFTGCLFIFLILSFFDLNVQYPNSNCKPFFKLKRKVNSKLVKTPGYKDGERSAPIPYFHQAYEAYWYLLLFSTCKVVHIFTEQFQI
jgi:hypothetical protein